MDVQGLKAAVRLAGRAPSVHNSQPWRWLATGNPDNMVLRLFVDRERILPATDRRGRQAVMSCGVALDHLRVAAAAAGWHAGITRFPDPADPDQLASIEFRPTDRVTAAQQGLAQAVLHRRTDRLALESPTFWQLFEPVLRGSVDSEVVRLDVIGDDARSELAEASRLSAALRRDDPYYQDEILWWTAQFVLDDGIPESALASVTELARVDVGRDFPAGHQRDRRARLGADRSALLVLSTPEDTHADALRCGENLSTVLLECTMAGMATCPLTHLIEGEDSRAVVRGLIGHRGRPQVLIRVGTAPALDGSPAPTPRRPLDSILDIRPTPQKGRT